MTTVSKLNRAADDACLLVGAAVVDDDQDAAAAVASETLQFVLACVPNVCNLQQLPSARRWL